MQCQPLPTLAVAVVGIVPRTEQVTLPGSGVSVWWKDAAAQMSKEKISLSISKSYIYRYYMYYTAMCVNIIGQPADSCLFVNHCVEELWHDLVQIQHGSKDIQHITYLQTFGNDDKPQLDYVSHFSQPMRWRRHKEVMINLSIAASSN